MGLGVRPQLDPRGVGAALHQGQVPLEGVEVEDGRRGRDQVARAGLADEGEGGGDVRTLGEGAEAHAGSPM